MKKLILTYFLLGLSTLFAQSVGSLQATLQQYERRADALVERYQHVDSLSAQLTAEIQLLQQAAKNRQNKRKLAQLYPQADVYAGQKQAYWDELTLLFAQIELTQRNLLSVWQTKLDSLQALPQSTAVVQQISRIRTDLAELQTNAYTPPLEAATEIAIHADDTPQAIEAKADLYRDRADKYREKAAQLITRRKQVEQERKLRQRVAEMVADVRLMDSRDEIQVSQNANPTDEKALFQDDEEILPPSYRNDANWGGTNVSNTITVRTANNLLNFNFRSASVDFDEYINNLQAEEKKLLAQADSLYHIADEYDSIHKDMIDQLK